MQDCRKALTGVCDELRLASCRRDRVVGQWRFVEPQAGSGPSAPPPADLRPPPQSLLAVHLEKSIYHDVLEHMIVQKCSFPLSSSIVLPWQTRVTRSRTRTPPVLSPRLPAPSTPSLASYAPFMAWKSCLPTSKSWHVCGSCTRGCRTRRPCVRLPARPSTTGIADGANVAWHMAS